MGALLWLCMASVRARDWKTYPVGYAIVFFVALISKMLASNVILTTASLGASIWAIIFGFCLRNVIDFLGYPLPGYLKVAQQTELYIAVSLVLLCIDIGVLKPLAPRALFVSWIDTPLLFMVVAWVGWRVLKIDRQTAIILSGATFICGSSAAIALGASMGVPHKSQMPIAIISIFTIPSIIALPYIAQRLDFSSTVSGAWFGGCVDSTGGVIAAASIYGDKEAIDTSAVVKMVQNVLIGPLSVLMAWAWSQYELYQQRRFEEEELLAQHNRDFANNNDDDGTSGDGAGRPTATTLKKPQRDKAHVLLWKRFPKFVIGFVLTALLFNTTLGDDSDRRGVVNDFCFYVSEWFSTLSFVSIGLGLQLNEMKQNIRNLGMLCTLYLVAQTVDIAVTGLLAWVAFTFM
ncbi:hypothetical protein BDB00DRAFT_762246 [Zychaea mexicana]|uniref:uncharacterized protein n=1 Tax=Zychaea mexicana TaxID=64656 RepID=UPI0022FED839|nr:uncharacterized protein BDB00DRAFT_762246 [Zychaea mexicana]KAI9494263.1 hypothetical protein BDB00DRAFT_762246 [Zychaea mexicana]